MFLAWKIARRAGQVSVATLLLAGIAINAIAMAGTGLLTFHANDEQLRSLTFWTMGSLGHAAWHDLVVAGPWLLLALLMAQTLATPLDAFLMGESVVGHLASTPSGSSVAPSWSRGSAWVRRWPSAA